MTYRITADDRARFKRCRREWDYASPHRRDLEPVDARGDATATALGEALTAFYYPGTWDWQHSLKTSLVHKAFALSLADAQATDKLAAGEELLDCYDAWAATVDDFAPVRVNHDTDAMVPDPTDPERGLRTRGGAPVFYSCRIDLMAMDAADECWVLRHQIVDAWQDLAMLLRDEEIVAACWAAEQDYLGLQVAGTIHNEIRVSPPFDLPPAASVAAAEDKRVKQSDASGGGRSVANLRRVASRDPVAGDTNRVWQRTAGPLRRTRIRRRRAEIAAVATQLAAEAIDMTGAAIYPSPGGHCQRCDYYLPCLAELEGVDSALVLESRFRRRLATAEPNR